ncbi:MAG: ribulose-phosphate 3-epimerase [Candidatus Omnitrophota bacterium]
MKILVGASILSADFSRLESEIKRVEAAGVDMLHVDIMDGHFVPNITIGPAVVGDIRKCTKLPLDVHLMIEDPFVYAGRFIASGADKITVHIETVTGARIKREGTALKAKGVKLGVSLNPATPVEKIKNVLGVVDFVLVMTVNPGFGGQKFIAQVLPKIKKLRGMFKGDISVDGGINAENAKSIIDAGANILSAGTYIFKAKDTREAIRRLKWQ